MYTGGGFLQGGEGWGSAVRSHCRLGGAPAFQRWLDGLPAHAVARLLL